MATRKQIRVDDYGGTPWTQTIYQTVELTNQNDRNPENVVARQLTESLRDLGIDHVIDYGFDAVPVDSQNPLCPDEACPTTATTSGLVDFGVGEQEWGHQPQTTAFARCDWTEYLDTSAPVVAEDSNLLLTNNDGGGCASVGGNYGVAGASGTDSDPGDRIVQGNDDWAIGVTSALHEIGHNMGNGHADHAGYSWNSEQYWHRTPYGPADDPSGQEKTNRCGETIPSKQHSETMHMLYFWDCQAQHMSIEPKPPLDGGGGGPGGPEASFTVDQQGLSVWVDGTGSTGDVTSYEWDFGDGSTAVGANASHTYPSAGSYTITLLVESDVGQDTVTETVSVSPDDDNGGGGGPVPDVQAEFTAETDGLTVHLDGSPSTGGGEITLYEWVLDNGELADGRQVTYTYDQPGTYEIGLYVDSTGGGNSFTSHAVTVRRDGSGGGSVDFGTGELAAAGGLVLLAFLAMPEETRNEWIDRITG